MHSVHGFSRQLVLRFLLFTMLSNQVQSAFDAVRTAMRTERTARAQGAASRQAHFAAVMGRSIDSLIRPRDWSVRDTLTENQEL